MIRPLGASVQTFRADTRTKDLKTGEYKDPLMQWPLRGAAFTNEVGEALRPVIGGYATLSWAPALLYIGADVYDKYKNDQTEYSPDSRRCLKQAIFQGMASVFLPLIAVKAGQNSLAQAGKLTEDKISINSKEHIARIAEQFVANGKMHVFDGKDEECVKEFSDIVTNTLDFKNQKTSLKNVFKIFRFDKKEKVKEYSEKTIKDLIDLRKNLLNPTDEFKNNKWFKAYEADLKAGQTSNVAVKSVLTKFQQNKMFKGKFIKTLGGFVALGLAIKPIDHFVEEVLIGKYVGPEIDKIHRNK